MFTFNLKPGAPLFWLFSEVSISLDILGVWMFAKGLCPTLRLVLTVQSRVLASSTTPLSGGGRGNPRHKIMFISCSRNTKTCEQMGGHDGSEWAEGFPEEMKRGLLASAYLGATFGPQPQPWVEDSSSSFKTRLSRHSPSNLHPAAPRINGVSSGYCVCLGCFLYSDQPVSGLSIL